MNNRKLSSQQGQTRKRKAASLYLKRINCNWKVKYCLSLVVFKPILAYLPGTFCVCDFSDPGHDPQSLKQPYVKNGHTLPVTSGGGVIGGGRSPCNQGKIPVDSEFRMNPAWLPQPEDRRVRSPSDRERRGTPGSRATGLHENGWRGGGRGPHAHAAEDDWKAAVLCQSQLEDGRRGGRLHPEDGQKRPGLQKAPSEDGRRSRPVEADWKPSLPRHASAEEGRACRGESLLVVFNET